MDKTIKIEPVKFLCPYCNAVNANTVYLNCKSGEIEENYVLCSYCGELIELKNIQKERGNVENYRVRN